MHTDVQAYIYAYARAYSHTDTYVVNHIYDMRYMHYLPYIK